MVADGALLLARGSLQSDLDDPRDCLATVCAFIVSNLLTQLILKFENNGFLIGPFVFLGFLLDYLMPHIPKITLT